MIQGGDPNSRNAAPGIPLGAGDPNYTIPAEFNEKFIHKKGALSAARQPDNVNPKKNSSGSQFYIVDGTTFSKSELTTDMNKLNMAAQQLMEQNDSLQQVLFTVYQNQGPQAYGQKLVELKDYIAEQTGADVNKTISDARLEAYTTIGGAPHLDGEYTIFGQVIDGLDIIDKVASQPVDDNRIKWIIRTKTYLTSGQAKGLAGHCHRQIKKSIT